MKASEIRRGHVIMVDGQPCRVMDFQHRTPGNLRAFVQVRFRNLSYRPLRFQYRVWLTQPARCEAAADPSATLLLGGEKRLRPGQSEEWPFSTAEALRRDYRGRVWSCVMEVK